MTLGELLEEITEYINDGSIKDVLVRQALRRASRWVERNYSYQYMRGIYTVTLQFPTYPAVPEVITLPTTIKSILAEDGRTYRETAPRERRRFRKIDYDSFQSFKEVAWPQHYYQLDQLRIQPSEFSAEELFKADIPVAEFSDWEEDNDDFEHWLIDNAGDLLLLKTCEFVAPALRDSDFLTLCRNAAQEALNTTIGADEEMRDGGRLEQVGYAQDDLDDLDA